MQQQKPDESVIFRYDFQIPRPNLPPVPLRYPSQQEFSWNILMSQSEISGRAAATMTSSSENSTSISSSYIVLELLVQIYHYIVGISIEIRKFSQFLGLFFSDPAQLGPGPSSAGTQTQLSWVYGKH